MTFKKDYINYLLYTVVNSPESEFRDNYRLGKLVDTIMSMDDVMKVTYLTGKTAGLEGLFKYLLYISDKIDKSQVTIFNLKDNFDYDIKNLSKICEKISSHKSDNVQAVIDNIEEDVDKDELNEKANITADIEMTEENMDEEFKTEEETGDDEVAKLTLIENRENTTTAEVFELESISELEDAELNEENNDNPDVNDNISDESDDEQLETEVEETKEQVFELNDLEENPDEQDKEEETPETETEQVIDNLPEIEIEVHKPSASQEHEHVKEEAITNEAYYKFETRFFEEVKILEKLFVSVDKDCRTDEAGKLSEKCLQSLTEIIEITSELSSLSRQLSFDLIADIFLTMNLYFTKAISLSEILTSERIKLLDASLALVNSLIKGEDYLNYDSIVDKIERLKSDISGEKQEKYAPEPIKDEDKEEITEPGNLPGEEAEMPEVIKKPQVKQSQMDSAVFKLKYLVKEFEKSFISIGSLKGEYSKFDALEKISELNNALRMIAKISAIVKLNDVLKLAEVTYVFLKYVKDYRMDLMEPEIKQIVKYIIFTFKMLLTNRKPEDFNVLVQHLNNPVKIFADS
jgi:hypothetical protein